MKAIGILTYAPPFLLAGAIACSVSSLRAAEQDTAETWKRLKLLEIKGQVADKVQHKGWNLCRVKPPDGDEKEVLLANLSYDARKAFESWQSNLSPGPTLRKLEAEVAVRRAEYVAAVNSGALDRIEAATRNLETTREQYTRMRDLSSTDGKEDAFFISARATGQNFENVEIWDCGSQKELDAAYAVALKARKDQDARQAEAKARLKVDQELADKNDPDGLFKMAERYYLGDRLAGVNRDVAKARALYARAAAMGNADAATALKHLPPQSQATQ